MYKLSNQKGDLDKMDATQKQRQNEWKLLNRNG